MQMSTAFPQADASAALHQSVEIDDGDVPTPAQWLHDLDGTYTMEDERAKGKGGATRQGAASSVQSVEEVTFF